MGPQMPYFSNTQHQLLVAMEALIYTGLGLSIFCLGLATGAIIEHRLLTTRMQSAQKQDEIIDQVTKIEPLLISLADQIEREYITYTPVMYEVQDPDVTMELPIIQRGSHGEKEETW